MPRHGVKKSVPCRAVPCRGTEISRCRAVRVPWKNLKGFPSLPKTSLLLLPRKMIQKLRFDYCKLTVDSLHSAIFSHLKVKRHFFEKEIILLKKWFRKINFSDWNWMSLDNFLRNGLAKRIFSENEVIFYPQLMEPALVSSHSNSSRFLSFSRKFYRQKGSKFNWNCWRQFRFKKRRRFCFFGKIKRKFWRNRVLCRLAWAISNY